MADPEQLAILRQGSGAWNHWRAEHAVHQPDLSGADFSSIYSGAGSLGVKLQAVNLSEADLRDAQLPGAEFQGADLSSCDLAGADLTEAKFMGAELRYANLSSAHLHGAKINDARAPYANFSDADLTGTYLWGSDFREADFRGANLTGANLMNTQLVRVKFQKAILVKCKVFGIAAWELELEGAVQKDLNINRPDAPAIVVDDLELAQFLYLLLDNRRLRRVIDTITSKVVLILGRFTPERKAVLDALRECLRKNNYVPILFDFPLPGSRDITETVTLLARMARFIVADLTAASSIGKELEAIVPGLAVPVQPLLEGSTSPYSMFADYWKYDWVLPLHRYEGLEQLLNSIEEEVIAPATAKVLELERRRRAALMSGD
jgi:uncharacterized protein YjbI with pentapeptide repeats